MEITHPQGDNVPVITLTPEDVESAVRQFICTCHPELAVGYAINPSRDHKLQGAVFVAWPSADKIGKP